MSTKAVNVSVSPRHRNEHPDRMVKRFLKKCKKEKILEKYREGLYYEKPSIKRREAAKRRRKVLDKARDAEQKIMNASFDDPPKKPKKKKQRSY